MLSRRGVLGGAAASVLRGQNRKSNMFVDAEAYERFMGRWSRLLAPQLVDLAGLDSAGSVLDAGSGTGVLAFCIARLRPHCMVVGIDPSEEFVRYARAKNASPERVSFETGDAQRLRFPDANFAAALSLLVFNFIPDNARALSEVKRVTKPGGPIALAVWDYGDGMRMLRVFWDAVRAVDPGAEQDESRMQLCREGELGAFCRRGGLEHIDERPLEIGMRFTSFADYWEPFLTGTGPAGAYVRQQDSAGRRKLRAELKRRLGLEAENVPFVLPARAWAARGSVPGRG